MLQELFEQLQEQLEEDLEGGLNYAGDVIKYEYDGFQHFNIDENDLEEICYEDRCQIDEWLNTNDDEFFTTEPEIHDKIIYFYIEK